MTRHRPPSSLQHLCLHHLCLRLDNLCLHAKLCPPAPTSPRGWGEEPRASQLLGGPPPPVFRPGPVVGAAVAALQARLPLALQASVGEYLLATLEVLQAPITPWHVDLCLKLQVSRIVVSGSSVEAGVLEEASASAIHRMSLYYAGNGDKASRLYNFLATATNLTHLTLTDFCNNSMLQVIASTCENLSHLEISTSSITDDGILRLCGLNRDVRQNIGVLSQGGTLHPFSRCVHSLRQIKMHMTGTTQAGVAIMLFVLPSLELLHVEDIAIDQFLQFMVEYNLKNTQCNLVEFHFKDLLVGSNLSVLTEMCPNLEYIQVSFTGDFESDHLTLSILTTLKKLKIVKFANVQLEAFLMFMEIVGNQITELYIDSRLSNMTGDPMPLTRQDIQSLAKFCPNLTTLNIKGYTMQPDGQSLSGKIHYFHNLIHLHVENIIVSEEDLSIFFAHCQNVQDVEVVLGKHHVIVNDRFIDQMLQSGNFQNLLTFRISQSAITFKAIVRLIVECPALEEIGRLARWLTSKEQIAELKEKAKSDNLDIGIY